MKNAYGYLCANTPNFVKLEIKILINTLLSQLKISYSLEIRNR